VAIRRASALNRYGVRSAFAAWTDEESSMTLSARNHLIGTIDEIQWGDVLVHVTVRVGDHIIESVITRRSAEEMALKKGDAVTAVVKATEVMLSKG
jgi:molybdopterin-binding protein